MSTYYNVCSEQTIQENNNTKTIYQKIGRIKVTENGGWFLHLYHQPQTNYRIFSSKEDNLPTIDYDATT